MTVLLPRAERPCFSSAVTLIVPEVASRRHLELVTPVNAAVARPLVEGLKNPTVARDSRLRELVPFELTPFDEAARRALGASA